MTKPFITALELEGALVPGERRMGEVTIRHSRSLEHRVTVRYAPEPPPEPEPALFGFDEECGCCPCCCTCSEEEDE